VAATLRAEEGRAELEAAGVEVHTLDVTDETATQAVVAAVLARHGGLDAVVANAGAGLFGTVEDLDLAQVRSLFELNVLGAMATVRAALPALRARQGRVVLVSSIAGRRGAPGSGAYNASKFALEGLAEALAFELEPFGVRVTVVEPGATDTGFFAARAEGARSGTGPYAAISARLRTVGEQTRGSIEPVGVVVGPLIQALEAARPPFRLPVGRGTRGQLLAYRLLPWTAWSWLVRRRLRLPRG